jgi:hypothetical protein
MQEESKWLLTDRMLFSTKNLLGIEYFTSASKKVTISDVAIYPRITPSGTPRVMRVNISVLFFGSLEKRTTQTGK